MLQMKLTGPGTCIRRRDVGRSEPVITVGPGRECSRGLWPIRNGSFRKEDDPKDRSLGTPNVPSDPGRIGRIV